MLDAREWLPVEETSVSTLLATLVSSKGLTYHPKTPSWNAELRALTDIWQEEAVQEVLTKKLEDMGYHKDLDTYRSKVKEQGSNSKLVKGNSWVPQDKHVFLCHLSPVHLLTAE